MVKKPTPGEVLKELFLQEYGLTQKSLAQSINVPPSRINDIIHGRRSIEPDTAIRLSRFFGNSPQFWLNLQNNHDLRQLTGKGHYKHIKPIAA